MRFSGRVAVVTGAARGIGRAVSLAFLREGASVAAVDLDAAGLEGLVKDGAAGGTVLPLCCNIASYSEVEAAVRRAADRYGRLDILVNNAGVIERGDIETVTQAQWERVLAVNLTGTFNCCRAVVPYLKGQGGSIVNVSSIAAKLGDITSAPGYGPSKAGVDALTKTLARQLAALGIRVNGVAPHAIATEMSAQWSDERRRQVIAGIPLGRLGRAEEVAEAVLFLASEAASFITGEIIDVNGGALMD